jgi:hypothetical protein
MKLSSSRELDDGGGADSLVRVWFDRQTLGDD